MNDQDNSAAVPTINWDDSSMTTTHANVCNVMGTREEIMILFGSNQAWNPEKIEVKVTLTNRMILNPYAAKRLAALLSIGLTEYEKRFGELVL